MSSAAMITLVNRTAEQLNVQLEPFLCKCTIMDDGTPQMIVTLRHRTEDEEEVSLLRSAFMCEILEHAPNAMVQVHVPSPAAPYFPPRPRDAHPVPRQNQNVNQWIQEQALGIHTWARDAAILFCTASFTRLVESYPWRDKKAMAASIDTFVREVLDNIKTGLHSPIMMGDPCRILVPLESILGELERSIVVNDVIIHQGKIPSNVLDTYEGIYDLVMSGRSHNPLTAYVFHQIFQVA